MESCGIYSISCSANGKQYVGSSSQIQTRWRTHRRELNRGSSVCTILQNAWTFYSEAAFQFSVLEECPKDVLEAREQHYIDTLKPALNSITEIKRRYGVEMRAKMAASLRARAAKITHCPKGHAYDAENTYIGNKGKRICRRCAYERNTAAFQNETPEQREVRLQRAGVYYEANRESLLEQQAVYTAAHKDAKRAYDRANRAKLTAQKRVAFQAMSVEERAAHNARKMESYRKTHPPVSLAERGAKISAALKALPTRRGPTCPHGHPYDDTNTLIEKSGKYVCRTCRNGRKRAKRAATSLPV